MYFLQDVIGIMISFLNIYLLDIHMYQYIFQMISVHGQRQKVYWTFIKTSKIESLRHCVSDEMEKF